jgi:multiple sugar transport system permease protein
MVIVALLQFIWIFNHFDIVYIMTRGGPARATEVLSTYAYESAFRRYTIGYGSTIGSIMFVVLVITMLLYLRIIERADH